MVEWYGTGHTLVKYEPFTGGMVDTDAASDQDGGDTFRFTGRVLVFDPPRELTFEQDWLGHGWIAPALITLRLTPVDGGTLVELFHHGFERVADDPGELLRGFEAGWTTRQLEALRRPCHAVGTCSGRSPTRRDGRCSTCCATAPN